jgi:hypothetical protein
MRKLKRLWDLYRFPGFSPEHILSGIFGDSRARVIALIRRGKKRFAVPAAAFIIPITTGKHAGFETCPAETCGSIWRWRSAVSRVEGAGK